MLAMPLMANTNANKSNDVITKLRPTIKKVAKENEIDPILMEAIMRHESEHGKSKAARTKNNLAGIMGRDKKQRSYATKAECVEHLGTILANYKAKGRVTVSQIGCIYCTTSGWAKAVNKMMRLIKSGRY